ncbi:AraC family transcriptional regulator [Paenibacillus nasutitermitis]|uniref:Transcriptional regulator n=1 Tax=Paenibacillus nasutitermitis TaxID=1652958 RepID=A0A916ZBZ6_9BACL|nr:AraC family transcriptional regulator [Paenibacillus nasutitermitis]GGD84876.1 transcriptional regulator [Paenibacillus nasutitermitis]
MERKADGFEAEKIIVLPPYILKDMVAHPLIRQLYITDIGYFPKARHHYRDRPLGCEMHILIYCAGGEGWITRGSQPSVRVTAQTLTVIPAGMPHSYGADENNPWSIYWFHLMGEDAAAFFGSLNTEAGQLRMTLSHSVKLLDLFEQCYDILSAKPYSMDHQVHVSQIMRYWLSFAGLMNAGAGGDRSERHIEQAIQFMQEQLESNLTLEKLAAHTRISRQHLNHLFKQSTGFAPIDYYLRMKIQRAGQLLDLTDRSMKDISLSLGFQDPYYFSRLFKKMIGLSPTEYRNKLKG